MTDITPSMRSVDPAQREDFLYTQLLKSRIVWLGEDVRDDNANAICSQLLLLSAEDPEKDIYLYINSPGGSVTAGMAIYDTMQYIRPRVGTVCIGQAASMGSFLLAAGEPGMRIALPNARIMVHQPSGGAQGQASDIQIQAREILDLRERLNRILADNTGQTMERIGIDTERDNFMSAEDAVSYGLVDKVMSSRTEG